MASLQIILTRQLRSSVLRVIKNQAPADKPFNLVILAMAAAILLNRGITGLSFYRLAIFIPVVTSMACAAVVWRHLFEPDVGLVNYLRFYPK